MPLLQLLHESTRVGWSREGSNATAATEAWHAANAPPLHHQDATHYATTADCIKLLLIASPSRHTLTATHILTPPKASRDLEE